MPQETLNFAVQLTQEWLELRHLVHEKEAKVSTLLDSEAAYVDLIETLAEHPLMLNGMPELMGKVTAAQYAVFSHLVFRTLQADWCHSWLSQIQSQTISLDSLNLIGFLPSTIVDRILLQARSMGGVLRLWAAQYISRNERAEVAKQWSTDKEGINDKAVVALCGQYQNKEYYIALQVILTELIEAPNCKIDEFTVQVALALMQYKDPQGIAYLRRPDVISHPASRYGQWLASLGTEQDIRLIEQTIESKIAEYDSQLDPICSNLKAIVGMIQTLGSNGDARFAMWCYNKLLPHSQPRLRYEGFNAMLGLYDQELVAEGYLKQQSFPELKDELGHYILLEARQCRLYWELLQQQVGKQQILPAGRCRAGKRVDQLAELIEQITSLTYGDNHTADRLRLTISILIEQRVWLDCYAPYEQFVAQQSNCIEQIERFRLRSQYVVGSFKL